MKNGLKIMSVVVLLSFVVVSYANDFENAKAIDKLPEIFPDYTNVTIPPNIAPLNFKINEPGNNFVCQILNSSGLVWEGKSKKGKIQIPIKSWKALLEKSVGDSLLYTIYIKNDGTWNKYRSFNQRVVSDKIDSHLAYRLIDVSYAYWNKMGLYQRNAETFYEKPIIENTNIDKSCVNCHNFSSKNPDKMMFHVRAGKANGTLLYNNGELQKIETKTDFNKSGAYPSWHPNGKMIAYSVNKVKMFYHTTTKDPRDVYDMASDVIIYNIETNTVSSNPQVSSKQRMETFPHWAPDGKTLYFCSSPSFEDLISDDGKGDFQYNEHFYELFSIPYDFETDTWGELTKVLSLADQHKSITFPRVSQDGRYLIFTTSPYGTFPIYHREADLNVLDLQTGEWHPLASNSEETDSYHSWSSNSKWILFGSKRMDQLTTRPFYTYFENGHASKPFVLPQKNPEFYTKFLKNYNIPEMISGEVKAKQKDIVKTLNDNRNKLSAQLDKRLEPQNLDNENDFDLYKRIPGQ